MNTHHDNAGMEEDTIPYESGYCPSLKDITKPERFIFNVRRQIAIAFNIVYDHHLISEGLNEPRRAGYKYEWNYEKNHPDCKEGTDVLMNI